MQPDEGAHESSVQGLASEQSSGWSPSQVPAPSHWSFAVHASASSHGVPNERAVLTQACPPSQSFAVQSFPSSQSRPVVGAQEPSRHRSPELQALPSSQPVPSGTATCAHPAMASQ
jgi:hypothetical protein